MNLAPLQLEAYALLDLACRANQEHTPSTPTAYTDTDLRLTTLCDRDEGDPQHWRVRLGLNLQPRPEANAPYAVSLHLTGVIRVLPTFEAADPQGVVKANGATLLYGVARELVRQVTSAGPFAPVVLPTMTFAPEPSPTPPAAD